MAPDMLPEVKACAACGCPVRWIRMKQSGDLVGLDADPTFLVTVEASGVGVPRDCYVPHARTCKPQHAPQTATKGGRR